LARDIIHLLYGNSYLGATDIFKILIWVVPIGFVRSSYSNPLLALGLQRLNAIATSISVFITIILNLILIPTYGIYGAAVACVACEIMVLFFMTLIFSKRVYRSIPFDAYFFKIFVSCVLMGVLIGMVHVNVIIKIILGAASYGILAIVLGVMDRKAILGFYSTVVNSRKKV
jgi:O-antigen/teichoic acid export membrane protein